MGRKNDLIESLARVPLFAACSKADLKILCRHMVEVEVPAGASIVRQGEIADAFYVVVEGEADVRSGTGKRARTIAKLGPGSFFGELAILDAAPRNASVSASTPMVLGVLGARVFRAVLRDVPAMTEKLLAGMARRLREADRVLNDVTSAPKAKAASRRSVAASGRQPHPQRRTARSSRSPAR